MGGQWEVSGKHLPSHIPIKFLRPAYEKFVP